MAIPALDYEQFQYTDTGVVMNGDDTNAWFADIEKIDGLDSTDLRVVTHDREGVDGGYLDSEFEGMRTVILDGTLYVRAGSIETVLDKLKANYAPRADVAPLYFGTDSNTRAVFGKSQGFKYVKDQGLRIGKITYQVQVICPDPRIYSPGEISQDLFISDVVDVPGRAYNKSYDYGYGSTNASSNKLEFEIGGNRNLPGILTIHGPIDDPQIIYDNTGTVMDFNISLAEGDTLAIDLDKRTVMFNGTTGRRNTLTLTGNWYLLEAGTNSFRLNGDNVEVGTTRLNVSSFEAAWR